MARNLDAGLFRLKECVVSMGDLVEQAVGLATARDAADGSTRLQTSEKIESKVNLLHKEIDDLCFKLLALHQPFAQDLRVILAAIKTSNNLERMADLALGTIRQITEAHQTLPPEIEPLIVKICVDVQVMVKSAIAGLVQNDPKLASSVLQRDDLVDDAKRDIVARCIEMMKNGDVATREGLGLVFVSKNLERIADHATNIAEDIIFVLTGQDIRHPSQARQAAGK